MIEAQLEVLFGFDPEGRLTGTREPVPQEAPRFYLGRSGAKNVFALRHDVDEATAARLEQAASTEPLVEIRPGLEAPSCRPLVLDVLSSVRKEWRGPAFLLPEDLPEDRRARCVSFEEPSPVWLTAFPWLAEAPDLFAPISIAFAGGVPAAVCHSPRGSTHSAAEAGVVTLEPYRGRGLASAAVTAWAREVQRSGRAALYSTSWENEASLGVARRLSAELYGENWHWT